LLACVSEGGSLVERQFDALLNGKGRILYALVDHLAYSARALTNPKQVGNHLAFLYLDLADEQFHAASRRHAVAFRKGIAKVLRAAVAAGELPRCRVSTLARHVQVVWNGTILVWAIMQEGNCDAFVRNELNRVLRDTMSSGR
jgi:hypothetical protein